jgi:hypothetical protein
MIVAIGGGDRLRSSNVALLSAKKPQMSALSVAKTLEGFTVPKGTSLKAAQVLSSFESLCGGGAAAGMTKGEMDRIRQRADSKWVMKQHQCKSSWPDRKAPTASSITILERNASWPLGAFLLNRSTDDVCCPW